MVQLSASYFVSLSVLLVLAAITLCVAFQLVIIIIIVVVVVDPFKEVLDTPSYLLPEGMAPGSMRNAKWRPFQICVWFHRVGHLSLLTMSPFSVFYPHCAISNLSWEKGFGKIGLLLGWSLLVFLVGQVMYGRA
jgi:hypothetical protein